MKKSRLYLLILFLSIFYGNTLLAQDMSLSVIANEKGAPEALTISELKRVFRGEKQWWNDGTKIVIALMKTSTPSGSATAKKLLEMSGDELNKYWLSLVFQGKAKAPAFFNSEKELMDFVNQNKGSIGIIDKNSAGSSRTITVENKNSF
ncbi:MAG TPA: hypothetical protein PKD91_04285 [Bacteroidia bacterium]|nr:hypothetical protein [Bacteroidia bacterium]